MSNLTTKKIKGKECKFATYVPPSEPGIPDLHFVKEVIHYEDGTKEVNMKELYDMEFPFWVTKRGMQNHEQKKEWAPIESLDMYKSTRANRQQRLARALNMTQYAHDPFHMRKLMGSPYVYGADILTTAVIKREYQVKYPGITSMFSVGVIDIETDVIHGHGGIIMLSFTMGSICVTAVTQEAVKDKPNIVDDVDKMMNKYLGKYVTERKLQPLLYIVEDEFEVIRVVFEHIHKAQPDFLAVWNLDFEITNFIAAAERCGRDLAPVTSDPKLDPKYHYFQYKQGPKQKKTSSGKLSPIKPAAQWHTVYTPASFYFVDAMCAYKHTRLGKQEEQSYSLDAILTKEKLPNKLDIPEAEGYTGLAWHKFMQKYHMAEYIVYNRFDCIGVEILEEKVKDLPAVMPGLCATSDFENMKSQPRRVVDALHWVCLDEEHVIGTTANSIVDEHDDLTLSREDWIITLPAPLITANGLKLIEENEELRTSIYGHVGDLDVAASYPNGECVHNISKETTSRELCAIEGIDEEVFRAQNMLLTGGHVNAVEYCTTMYNFPQLYTLLEDFKNKDAIQA